jgi:hypothetical protein
MKNKLQLLTLSLTSLGFLGACAEDEPVNNGQAVTSIAGFACPLNVPANNVEIRGKGFLDTQTNAIIEIVVFRNGDNSLSAVADVNIPDANAIMGTNTGGYGGGYYGGYQQANLGSRRNCIASTGPLQLQARGGDMMVSSFTLQGADMQINIQAGAMTFFSAGGFSAHNTLLSQ